MNQQTSYYYRILWRKSLRILPRLFLTLVITAALFLGTALVLRASNGQTSVLPKIKVGVVLDGNDLATRLTVSMVEQVDAVNTISELTYLSDEEAMAGLRDGSVQAAIYLPKNVYEDINSGTNTPIVVKISSAASLSAQVFQDLISSASSMLQTGEATAYTIYEVGENYETSVSAQSLMDTTAQNFLSYAMKRGILWNYKTLSSFGDIPMEQFYLITALIAAMLLLAGMSFGPLYQKEALTVDRCLKRIGLLNLDRTLSRLSAITAILWVLHLLALAVLSAATDLVSFSPVLIPALLPLAFSEAALIHVIYVLTAGISGELLYLLVSLLAFLIGGGLFPPVYLPGGVLWLSRILPIHLWQQYFYDILWNGFSFASLGAVLLAGIVLTIIGTVGYRIYERD